MKVELHHTTASLLNGHMQSSFVADDDLAASSTMAFVRSEAQIEGRSFEAEPRTLSCKSGSASWSHLNADLHVTPRGNQRAQIELGTLLLLPTMGADFTVWKVLASSPDRVDCATAIRWIEDQRLAPGMSIAPL